MGRWWVLRICFWSLERFRWASVEIRERGHASVHVGEMKRTNVGCSHASIPHILRNLAAAGQSSVTVFTPTSGTSAPMLP